MARGSGMAGAVAGVLVCGLVTGAAADQRFYWSGPVTPSPRITTLAYDGARGVTVLFGGGADLSNNDTHEWDGTHWIFRGRGGPSPRWDHAMAYDAARQVVVLFGGVNDSYTTLGDTWEWNGQVWRLAATGGPGPRYRHALAYDSVRHVTVLYGGATTFGGALVPETWEWDGQAWLLRDGGPGPGAWPTGMAFDAARGVTVLLANRHAGGTYVLETWTWNGATWEQVATTNPDYYLGAVSYDSTREVVVYFTEYGAIWEWNGSTWTLRSTGTTPPQRMYPTSAYDAARGVTLVFGGVGAEMSQAAWMGDLWAWDGATWAALHTEPFRVVIYDNPGVSSALSGALAYDSDRGMPMLYCTVSSSQFNPGINGTYEWDGTQWLLRGTEQNLLDSSILTYDAARHQMLRLMGTWTYTWDGQNWTQRASTGPSSRGRALTYDSRRQVAVGFYNGVTWEWDGASWTQRASGTPAIVAWSGLAYDPGRGVSVLYGGRVAPNGDSGETWEWDGSTWRLAATTGPGPRSYHSLVYDADRETVILFGGGDPQAAHPTYYGDTWEWNGTAWSQVDPGTGPRPRTLPALTYDAGRHTGLVFGGVIGIDGNNPSHLDGSPSDTWQFRTRPVGDVNCDGRVDFGDINPFVAALTDPAAYATRYPFCDLSLADVNDDGHVDFGDINPFVALLSGGRR